MVYEASHNWVNKMMGLKPEDHDYYHWGKAGHDNIQRHVSGRTINKDLKHIPYTFPLVEEKDFDERLKFNVTLDQLINIAKPSPDAYKPKDEYNIIGFFDGLNKPKCQSLEIKISSTPWSVGRFHKLMQRKLYALALPMLKETICVTGYKDIKSWKTNKPKYFPIPNTKEEKVEAIDWILGGIKIIESGDYTGGLDATGVCALGDRCYFGQNCSFASKH